MATVNPELDKLSADLYRQWEKAMGGWWDTVLESPAFLGAMGQNLSAQTQARATWETTVDENLERMHLPTRKDLIRVARIASLLEDRLLAQEDMLLAMTDKLAAVERDAVQARIEAAEARLELRETLALVRADIAKVSTKSAPRRAS